MSGWIDEVLCGVRKRDESGRGVELRNMQIEELSGVDDPAHGVPDWLLMKSASDLKSLTDDELDARIADLERASAENASVSSLQRQLQKLKNERARRARVQKNLDAILTGPGWGERLVQQGGTIRFR